MQLLKSNCTLTLLSHLKLLTVRCILTWHKFKNRSFIGDEPYHLLHPTGWKIQPSKSCWCVCRCLSDCSLLLTSSLKWLKSAKFGCGTLLCGFSETLVKWETWQKKGSSWAARWSSQHQNFTLLGWSTDLRGWWSWGKCRGRQQPSTFYSLNIHLKNQMLMFIQ